MLKSRFLMYFRLYMSAIIVLKVEILHRPRLLTKGEKQSDAQLLTYQNTKSVLQQNSSVCGDLRQETTLPEFYQ